MYNKKDLTNLTEKLWQSSEFIFDYASRKRKHSLKEIFKAIAYVAKSGCQWRMLPSEFPKWQLVYYYFQKWLREGIIWEICENLRNLIRKKTGKNVSPSVGIIDSQSVKSGSYGGERRGFDGNKKINGRKRHVVTDTNGLLLAVVVHAANEFDGKKAFDVIETLDRFERMQKIYADGSYRGDELSEKLKKELNYDIEITLRSDKETDFKPLPKRWVIERSFAWFNGYRRLSKDYEKLTETSEAMIMITFICLMLNNKIWN
jgi:putative transposase